MERESLERYARISQPPRDALGFVEELRCPTEYHFRPDAVRGGIFGRGFRIEAKFVPEHSATAFASLRRLLAAAGSEENAQGYPIRVVGDPGLAHEEYRLTIAAHESVIAAADADGLRRGIYFFEDRIRECGGAPLPGEWRRRPWVRRRISRCFFGPTGRPPFMIDELMNEVDYYPEAYLDKLAHEGINGLWLTVYFHDLPSSLYPERGAGIERRLAKLRWTVDRCAEYGISIYLFTSEPKLFGPGAFAIPLGEARPELLGRSWGEYRCFCTSSEEGKLYLRESVETLFRAVPRLGGMINIMRGEDSGACVNASFSGDREARIPCPRCSGRPRAEIYRETAEIFRDAMRRYNPDAEFIGWFYTPAQRDGSIFTREMEEVARQWPRDCTLMLNFESGGRIEQLGKKRIVFDYSLAYIGPSQLVERVAATGVRCGAKLQVGCSHEDASIPFMPVPGNLWRKYRRMRELGITTAMQYWYFGNYPGTMNKAAGELSFEPFCEDEHRFLLELARPDWHEVSETVACAWECFGSGYRCFPGNIAFEWYGPLHNSLSWPWHLFPVDEPLAPTWLLEQFPAISGDRVGEALHFHHTLDEALELCRRMSDQWRRGVELLLPLRERFADDPARLADIGLAEAVGLQMASTVNMLEFYREREEMFFTRCDRRPRMLELLEAELAATRRMLELCRADSRLGYHSEAEGYLFFPEKLEARAKLLEELRDRDFPRFRLDDEVIDRWTGRTVTGPAATVGVGSPGDEVQPLGDSGCTWCAFIRDGFLVFRLDGWKGAPLCIEIEPRRLWPVIRIDVSSSGALSLAEFSYREVPELFSRFEGERLEVALPLRLLDEFRRPGFPLRVNLRGPEFAWIAAPPPWPHRLLQLDGNPAALGWLLFPGTATAR